MINYLVTTEGQSTITGYLRTRGRALAHRVRVVPYEQLPLLRQLPRGTFIFSDVERLAAGPAAEAADLWNTLANHGEGAQLLNHPTRSMRRFELLRTLYEHGANTANVHRVTDLRPPDRFPVFLRRENDHAGNLSPLLHSAAELEAALARLVDAGVRADDLLITGFCDTADADGVYRKYSAFRVGDAIVPRHLLFSRDWAVKIVDRHGPAEVEEELAYVRDNPHRDRLMAIFETARIEFGRIDYALLDDRIQVWEINTNPILGTFEDGGMPDRGPVIAHVTPAFAASFGALDDGASGRVAVTAVPWLETLRRRLRVVVEAVLRATGLARWELEITHRLGRLRRQLFG